MSLLPPEDEQDDIEVAWEDQQRISSFSKLNNRLTDIQDQLKLKQVSISQSTLPLGFQSRGFRAENSPPQEEKEYYDDLSTEFMLADSSSGPFLYRIGEAFFYLPLKDAKKQLKGDLSRYNREISDLNDRAEECQKGMKELKVMLYAKFGKQINLETNDE
ncbi:hypothetical protein BD324DRAFT_603088 [Kockovaella imperatae]|uniref:Prefoldin subunit 4 n=1 Tax=Kockovaella imperatae TaxID=4999 RepID=A0A1Y1UDY0_9TREE|nr:hypothetical protein BD324DRAFT_603088 [Kockovaella imperatae]ORX35716.1 hypothetical protein BD324DRAFT_603088 [Kockovaella imperatae]